MIEKIQIESLSLTDLEFAWHLTDLEKWGIIPEELMQLYKLNKKALYCAKIDNKRVGIIFGVDYGTFGFIGNLIVLPKMRGKGIGMLLMKKIFQYFEVQLVNTIMLDAVPSVAPLYEKLGFKKIGKSLRYYGTLRSTSPSTLSPISKENWDQCMQLDRILFGADREDLLLQLYQKYPQYCKCLVRDGKVTGFIMALDRGEFLKVGPWIVDPEESQPELLLEGLLPKDQEREIYLGVVAENQQSLKILEKMNIQSKFHSIRMVKGSNIQKYEGIYGIAGPDRG